MKRRGRVGMNCTEKRELFYQLMFFLAAEGNMITKASTVESKKLAATDIVF